MLYYKPHVRYNNMSTISIERERERENTAILENELINLIGYEVASE